MECPDCFGNGYWIGVIHRHDCESCDGTGKVITQEPEKDSQEESDGIPLPILEDDTEPLWALALPFPTPMPAGGDGDPDDSCD